MAQIIKSNGQVIEATPKNGTDFSLEELQTIVGGVSGLIDLLDGAIDLVNRLLDRAFNSKGDKCVCKLRRGLQISFYVF